MPVDVKNVVDWLKNWFYIKSEVYAKSETYTKEEVNTALGNKVNLAQGSGNTGKNVYVNSSGNIDVENHITAGSGLSLSNTNQMSHSNSVTAQSTSSVKAIKFDAQGHITEVGTPYGADIIYTGNKTVNSAIGELYSGKADSSHNQATTTITNSETYSNLGSNLTNQKLINDAINTVIGGLKSTKFIEIENKPSTPSADTMGILYIVTENSKVNAYYTKATSSGGTTTYEWVQLDANILDSLSWSDINDKPSSFTPSTHSHVPSEIDLSAMQLYALDYPYPIVNLEAYITDRDTKIQSISDVPSEMATILTHIDTYYNYYQ